MGREHLHTWPYISQYLTVFAHFEVLHDALSDNGSKCKKIKKIICNIISYGYGNRFLDENFRFLIISQSSSQTFKAHNYTQIETEILKMEKIPCKGRFP